MGRWRGCRTVGAVVVAAASCAVWVHPATAADADVSVAAAPGDVALVPGITATVRLVIANPTDAAVTVKSIDVRPPIRVAVALAPDPAAAATVPARGVASASFGLRAEPGFEEGSVAVLVDIVSPATGEAVRSTAVAVKRGGAPSALVAMLVSSPNELNDGHRGTAWLRVANDTPFTFAGVSVIGVDSQDVRVEAPRKIDETPCQVWKAPGRLVACIASLAPGAWQLVELRLSAHERVHVGTQHIALVVTGAPTVEEKARVLPASVVVAATVDVAVFGVSALGPLGVASTFILPGLMAVVVFTLLSRYAYPRRRSTPDTVDVKDPANLVFIVPSAALVYLGFWLVNGVDLTDKLGTGDVAMLFGAGGAIGFAAWAVFGVMYWQRSGRLQFAKNDSPKRVLERLRDRHAHTLTMPAATATGRSYRFLGEAPDGGAMVCSPIVTTWRANTTEGQRGKLRNAIADDDTGALLELVKNNVVALGWSLGTGVAELAADKFELAAPAPLVEGPDDLADAEGG